MADLSDNCQTGGSTDGISETSVEVRITTLFHIGENHRGRYTIRDALKAYKEGPPSETLYSPEEEATLLLLLTALTEGEVSARIIKLNKPLIERNSSSTPSI
jgi:hypothetical protein